MYLKQVLWSFGGEMILINDAELDILYVGVWIKDGRCGA